MGFRAALLQYELAAGDVPANLALLRELFAEAKEKSADCVLLPELFNCGYNDSIAELAESNKGKTVASISKLCAEYGLTMLGGSFAEKRNGRLYNTSLAISAEGNVFAKYRKVHLFDGEFSESRHFAPGDEWVLYDYNDSKIGLLTCFDLRFPIFIQNLTLRGAKILCISALWPAARLMHWQTLLRARAIENEAWVLACNSCGNGLAGHSTVLAPNGEIIAEAGEGQQILLADIGLADYSTGNILSKRRPILDEVDESQL